MPKQVEKRKDEYYQKLKIDKKKAYKEYDGDGLVMHVRPNGRKVWQYHYTYKGQRTSKTLGYHQKNLGEDLHLTVGRARIARDKIKLALIDGKPPEKENKHNKSVTFEYVANEWVSRQQWVDGHRKRVSNFLIGHVYPAIGDKSIQDIQSFDIKTMITALENKKKYGVAKELVQRCNAIFGYARRNFSYTGNPARDMGDDIPKMERKNRPHLKECQIPEFLDNLDKYTGREYIKIGLNLMLLNFTRPSELRCATWDEFDFKKAEWNIPAIRMKMKKDHVVPLSRQSVELLNGLKKATRNSNYLFPSIKSADKPISDVTFLKALKIMGYEDDKKIVPHGFRHTASTILHENTKLHGCSSLHIERQLAHVDKNKIRGVYNKADYIEERRILMQWYSDFIDQKRIVI